ncbi:hypothetical protein OBK30_01830 [Empedobacter falsenii]
MRYIITIAFNRITSINQAESDLTIEQGVNSRVKVGTYENLVQELESKVENIDFLHQQHEADTAFN